MNVAVVGAGVVGTLTAYFLQSRGCQVTVYDAADKPASLTSRANGGQLSYSFCDAMADPLLLPKLPGILLGTDPAFQIRPSFNSEFVRWGLHFIGQCTRGRRDANTKALLQLAQRSAELMAPLKERFGEHAAFSQQGKLVLLGQNADQETLRRLQLKSSLGFDLDVLSEEDIYRVEPALKHLEQSPVAAIFSPNDEAADAHLFTTCLTKYLASTGTQTRYNSTVIRLESIERGRCRLVTQTDASDYDATVIATGDGATNLLAPYGIRLPVLGMAGYSWTFPATSDSPSTSITALSKRIVFSRLGDVVRVAGFADVNPKAGVGEARAHTLRSTARNLLPNACDYDKPVGDWWQGVRAMTPDSRPIIGATTIPNVYTNLGHGMLGWTLGAATGEHVADQITKNEA